MTRIILAFGICVAAWATTPALAQSGSTDAVPTVSLAPSPAPYDSTAVSSQEPRRVQDAPQNAVPADAKQTTPPKEIPVAEGKVPEPLPVENAPQNSTAPESKPGEKTESRFTFSRMNDGYVRLDNRTGQVAFCSKRTVGWTCQLAPEDRGVLENEIARCRKKMFR